MITYQAYGDQAILINFSLRSRESFKQTISPHINAAVHALNTKIQAANLPEITFTIPAYCSLTVAYRPSLITYEALLEKLKIIEQAPFKKEKKDKRLLKIPVCYDPICAPDIEEVAKTKNLTINELIVLHTSITYDVYMLGFLPGFVYMGKLPEALEVPRKTNPRLRVPAGSVGLAGFQTGIYPSEAPGGWQIIGRTPYSIFEVNRVHPFLFEAGDRVIFEAIPYKNFEIYEKENFIGVKNNSKKNTVISITGLRQTLTSLDFQKTGAQTLIQDKGRKDYLSSGVPQSGAMDKKAARIANELVGNEAEAPVIEMTLIGASITIRGKCQIAITGADLSPKLNNRAVPMYETIDILEESILSFGFAKSGCRAYLAVGGSWQIPKILNSYSALPYIGKTATPESFIKKGTSLKILARPFISKKSYPLSKRPTFPKSLRVSVIAGPEFKEFSNYSIAHFFSKGHRISQDSNRMGYRLEGHIMDFKPQRAIISSGIVPGTIQITHAGQAVILMADAQTTGGYYRIANVVSKDLDALGQLKPGDEVWFSLVSSPETS